AVQLADVPTLESKAPGKFHVIYSFAKENPDLVTDLYYTTKSNLENEEPLLTAFLSAVFASIDDLYASSAPEVADLIRKYVPSEANKSEDELKSVAELYLDARMWPDDGGMSEDAISGTL